MKSSIVDSLPDILSNNSIVLSVNKGQRLFRQGDRANYLYLIQKGRFQEVSYPNEGEMSVLQILNTGETLGEVSLYSKIYSSTVIAQTNSQVIAYPQSILLEILEHSPIFIQTVVEIFAHKIHELQMRLEWRNISIADRRVLKYLKHRLDQLSEDSNNSQTFILDTPLQEIAAELGFVPGTLSRALAKLEADRTITRDKNRITLHDIDAA
ncbi:MAG: Crp/Fnr family transcriptional regulator [Pleurocapsa sp. MO_192.B19]|nr:Crp/Fnr family transcriptional regulator [Pleurocapsa sp. MO_192.B19]